MVMRERKGRKREGDKQQVRERQPEKEIWINCKQIMIEQDKYTIKRSIYAINIVSWSISVTKFHLFILKIATKLTSII